MPEKQDRHILIVFHTSLPEIKGGINKMIVTLARAWGKRGHKVSILSPGGWEDRLWSSHQYGELTVHRQRLRLPWDRERPLRGLLGWVREFPEILWKLRQFVRDERVDMIHLHTPREYQFFFRLLRFFGGPPYVITFHGTDALHFSLGQAKHMKLLRWIVRGASGVTAVAKHYATLIEDHHPDLAPVRAIANGICVSSASSPDIGPLALSSGPFTLPQHFFILVGWVEPPKAQDVAIQAWGLLKKNHPNLHLLIIGEEPLLHPGEPYYPGYLQKIKDMIVTLGCSATVHLVGSMSEETLYTVMKQSSGLVFPSQREGLPYVLLEAGLVGLPVVCSRIPAFCERIDHENNGLLFPVGDHVSLAREIDRLVRDEQLAKKVGTHWHHTVTNQLTDVQMADNYLDYFDELLERPHIAKNIMPLGQKNQSQKHWGSAPNPAGKGEPLPRPILLIKKNQTAQPKLCFSNTFNNHRPDGLFLGPLRPEDLYAIEQQPLHVPEGFHFVSSGHLAIRLLLRSLRLKAHARVALPALICPTVVNAIQAERMLPVFLDIEPPFFFMTFDPDTLTHLRPDALLLPHLYGLLHPKTGAIMAYCREEGVPLIHDAAQSFRLLWEGKPVIQQDQGGFYSFGPGKATTAATGALVWGINADVAKNTGLAKPRYWDPYAHAFMKQRMGLPSRFSWPRHPSRHFPASRVQIRAAHWVMANFATIEERRARNTKKIVDRLGPDLYEPLRGGRSSYKYLLYSPTPWTLPQDLAGIPFRRVIPFPASGNLPFYSSWNGFLYEISTERSLDEYRWYYKLT